jgi:recombination protein RecA
VGQKGFVPQLSIGEDKAKNMATAFALRTQIEAALAERIPSALTPAPRMVRPVVGTGVAAVDEVLAGGLPVGAVTEMIGAECSGRTSLALNFVAQVMREGKVCAWVDVSDALSPESAASCGVDLARLLWVRCGVVRRAISPVQVVGYASSRQGFAVPKKYFVAKPAIKGLHGGGMGGHPRGEAKGMDDAVSGLLGSEVSAPDISARCAEPQRRVRTEREVVEAAVMRGVPVGQAGGTGGFAGKPWGRIEQGLKGMDLLLAGGGFGALVLDLGGIAAEHVSRIPLATWFRYRAAAERTQTCVVLLTQHACAKSSAGLVLRLESGDAVSEGATVLSGFERRMEVIRQRFAQGAEKVVTLRKPPQRAEAAAWRSGMSWTDRRGVVGR